MPTLFFLSLYSVHLLHQQNYKKLLAFSGLSGLFPVAEKLTSEPKSSNLCIKVHLRSVVIHSERFRVIVLFLQATFIIICKN
jgi:hypothetical protein